MKALDLFCCAGGAAMGLHQAGYEVVGVDIRPQPHYPFQFIQGDAMEWLMSDLSMFDLIWASPPCQRYSTLTPTAYKANHPDLLPQVAAILRAQPISYIIENVEGTQHLMRNPIMLCGTMFGLGVWRHRWFEIGNTDAFFLLPPCNHYVPVLVSGTTRRAGRREHSKAEKTAAMNIDWMTLAELDEAIPPAYSHFLATAIKEMVYA